MKVATELSPTAHNLSVPTPPSADHPRPGPPSSLLSSETPRLSPMFRAATASHDVILRHNKGAQRARRVANLTRVNQQVQIHPMARSAYQISFAGIGNDGDTVCLPRSGGSRKERDTHNDEARDDCTWAAVESRLYAGTRCSRPASCHLLPCILRLFLGEVGDAVMHMTPLDFA
ncbi:hypothetical protein V500_04472 [Pseudogymnoascus sp. VKM F-4518 (FW-2643)]|nr:hypothetical protein V500_04472 [Pseudogymnoascus sp. VKM F-4518 (FW-2643)]